MEECKIKNLYNLEETIAKELLEKSTYPWEVLADIGEYILELGETLDKDEYEKVGENIHIKVNHVMEEDHYIEWILVKTEKENREVILKPGDTPEMTVPYEKGALIYAYCNKHGLWKTVVE